MAYNDHFSSSSSHQMNTFHMQKPSLFSTLNNTTPTWLNSAVHTNTRLQNDDVLDDQSTSNEEDTNTNIINNDNNNNNTNNSNNRVAFNEYDTEEEDWESVKCKVDIMKHPLYEQLLSTHVSCLKIATPVDQLPRIDAQLVQSQRVVSKYSLLGSNNSNHNGHVLDEKELDQFMSDCNNMFVFMLWRQ